MKINQNINFSVLDNQLTTTAGTITTITYTDQMASSAVDPTGAEKIGVQDEVRELILTIFEFFNSKNLFYNKIMLWMMVQCCSE